jgi:hypothetical protein
MERPWADALSLSRLRQPSYPSSVPQPGNGTSRADYPHYAMPDASSGAQRDRAAATTAGQALPLFDSRHGTMPHPTMLVHLVQVFFECFSRNFPFLQYEDVSRRVFNGTLSPLLANSIASLAARYSQSSDVLARGASAVSNAYGDAAKVSSPSGPLSSLSLSLQSFFSVLTKPFYIPTAPPPRQLSCSLYRDPSCRHRSCLV